MALRRRYIKVLLAIFLFMLPFLAMAQGHSSIKGTVTDASKETLPGITILLEGPFIKGTVTDPAGKFEITGMKAGTYTLKISGVGHETIHRTITLASSQATVLNLVMKEQTLEMDELIVIGESESLRLKKTGFEVESIETKVLQTQSIELNSVLGQVAGIKVRQEGGFGSRANYSINGLGGKAVRFFLDGVPMDYFGSSYSINTIPISLIQRVDVYKGVVPIELGNDALGGAINLITKEQFNNAAEVSYSFGSFNTHRASFLGNWRDSQSGASFKLSTFYNYSDNNYKVWGDDIYVTDSETYEVERGMKVERFHDAFKSKALKADAGFTQKKWADQVFIGMLYSDMDKEIQHGPTMEVPYGDATYSQHVRMPYLSYQKADFLLKGMHVNLFSAFSKLVRTRVDSSRNIYNWYGEVDGYRTLGGEQSRTLNTLTEKVFINRLNLAYHLNEKHKIGYNYVFNSLERRDRDPLITQKTKGYWSPQNLEKHSMGTALQSKWLGERLSTSLFAKWFGFSAAIKKADTRAGETSYHRVSAGESSFGYGLASSFKATPSLMLNASVEQANRLPEANELLGDGLNIISTTNLRPESSLNANLGFRLRMLDKTDHKIRLSGNAFYRDVIDLIQQYQYDLGAFMYINFDKVQMNGMDAKLQYLHKDLFTFHQTISVLDPLVMSEKDEQGNSNITHEARLPNTPFFQANSEARLHLGALINKGSQSFVYWNIAYVAAFYKHSEIIGKHNKDQIPEQLINNCGAAYTFPNEKVSLSIDFSNLFNRQAYDNFAIQKPGRAAYVKASYRIM